MDTSDDAGNQLSRTFLGTWPDLRIHRHSPNIPPNVPPKERKGGGMLPVHTFDRDPVDGLDAEQATSHQKRETTP